MRLCGGAGLGALPRCAAGGRGCSRTEVERVSGKNESDGEGFAFDNATAGLLQKGAGDKAQRIHLY